LKNNTLPDEMNPTSLLVARKSGKKITPGQTVTLQVRNPDSQLSNEFSFTRPA
jgi:ferredoxin-NADP reductase